MKFDFDDCYWHDSILESIYIGRNTPGEQDVVELVIKWYEDDARTKLVFDSVYLYKARMNFGIVALESIDMAYIAPADDPDLQGFYKGWKGMFDHVKLQCYIIKTSSTGSEIKILATGVERFEL